MHTPSETIIMFKPDARDILFQGLQKERLLHEVTAGLLSAAGLKVIAHTERYLAPSQVCMLYGNVLAPNPDDDAKWGSAWKNEVIKHICSGPVDSYLLQSQVGASVEVAREIKDWLRDHYGRGGEVIRNIAHVPDAEEFIITKEILFNDI